MNSPQAGVRQGLRFFTFADRIGEETKLLSKGDSVAMQWKDWYDSLVKPTWTPEAATIGMIWQII